MNKLKIGDKVRIVGAQVSPLFEDIYKDWFGKYFGETTTITRISKYGNKYYYRVLSNDHTWLENELESVEDDLNIEEENMIKLFQL